MFDETFIHHAENTTDQRRLILFCDVERPLHRTPVHWLNRVFARVVMAASATQHVEGEPVGPLNRLFGHVYQWRRRGKALKTRNRRLYYTLKSLAIGGVIALTVL